MTIRKTLSKLLQQHFEAHQQDDSRSAASRVSSIKKKVDMLQLNHGIGGLSLQQGTKHAKTTDVDEDDNDDDDINEILSTILMHYVDIVMSVPTKAGNQDVMARIIDLLAALATSYAETTDAVVARALEFSIVLLERVRAQSCKLLGALAKYLAPNIAKCEWAEESFDDIKAALVERLTDKSQSVRQAAIEAAGSCFLQRSGGIDSHDDDIGIDDTEAQETNSDDPLLEGLIWNLWHDPSPNSRAAALQSMPINQETINHIITRIRDNKVKVRVQALDVLRTNIATIAELTQDQLADIVQSGFSTRCEETKKATSKLVCEKWMKCCQFDPVLLLRSVNPVQNEAECGLIVKILMDATKDTESDILHDLSDPEVHAFSSSVARALRPIDSVDEICDPTTLLLARVALHEASQTGSPWHDDRESILSKIVPDIPVLCEVYGMHAKWLMEAIGSSGNTNNNDDDDGEHEDKLTFICLQLLQVFKGVGLQEEGSRRHFAFVMTSMLSAITTPDDLIEDSILALKAAYGDERDFIECVAGIVRTVTENKEKDADNEIIQTSNTLRILSILTIVFENASIRSMTPAFIDDMSQQVVPAVEDSNNPLVREAGVNCLGKLGLYSSGRVLMSEYRPMLLEVASNQDEKLEIRGQAILALSDWCVIFKDALGPCKTATQEECSFVDVLNDLVHHPEVSMVAIVAELVAKLHFAGKLHDSELLGRLVALYFDPVMADASGNGSEGDRIEEVKEVGNAVRLQQLLSLFFPAYCMKSEDNRDAFLGCIATALNVTVNRPKPKKVKKGTRTTAVPLARILDFVRSVVESAQAAQSPADLNPAGNATTTTTMIEAQSAADNGSQPNSREDADHDPNDQPSPQKKCGTSLRIMLQLAQFLATDGAAATKTNVRGLCKLLGEEELDFAAEEHRNLFQLKELMEDVGIAIDDAAALKHLQDLNSDLDGVEDVDDGSILAEDVDEEDEGDDSTRSDDMEDQLLEDESVATATAANDDEESSIGSSFHNRGSANESDTETEDEDLMDAMGGLRITSSSSSTRDKENARGHGRASGKKGKSSSSASSRSTGRKGHVSVLETLQNH